MTRVTNWLVDWQFEISSRNKQINIKLQKVQLNQRDHFINYFWATCCVFWFTILKWKTRRKHLRGIEVKSRGFIFAKRKCNRGIKQDTQSNTNNMRHRLRCTHNLKQRSVKDRTALIGKKWNFAHKKLSKGTRRW